MVLSLEEQKRFIEPIKGDRLEADFMVLLYTELRVGKLLALKWENIDFKEKMIKVRHTLIRTKNYDRAESKSKFIFGTPKSKKSKRDIPLLDDIVKLLKVHKANQAEEKLKAGQAYEDNDLTSCAR